MLFLPCGFFLSRLPLPFWGSNPQPPFDRLQSQSVRPQRPANTVVERGEGLRIAAVRHSRGEPIPPPNHCPSPSHNSAPGTAIAAYRAAPRTASTAVEGPLAVAWNLRRPTRCGRKRIDPCLGGSGVFRRWGSFPFFPGHSIAYNKLTSAGMSKPTPFQVILQASRAIFPR